MSDPATQSENSTETILNGVDIARLVETIRAVQREPARAAFQFRAQNRWIDGAHNRVSINGFHGNAGEHQRPEPFALVADEPPVLLGQDRGANPVEYLLAALSSCITITLAYHAAARGIELEAVESEFEGDLDMHGFLDLDPNVRKGFREIRARFRVRSDADVQTLQELAAKSPVLDIVSNPTPVRIEIVRD